MMGGVGFTKEFLAEKFYRDSKIGRCLLLFGMCAPLCRFLAHPLHFLLLTGQIYEGTSFIQLNTIAKCMDEEQQKK